MKEMFVDIDLNENFKHFTNLEKIMLLPPFLGGWSLHRWLKYPRSKFE